MLVKELFYIVVREYVSREFHVEPEAVTPEHVLDFFKNLKAVSGARSELFYIIYKILFNNANGSREQLSVFLTWLRKPSNIVSVRNLIIL